MFVRLAAVAMLAVGCGPSTRTTVDSHAHTGAAPFRTVMVFTAISDPPFAGEMNLGFEDQLRADIAACGGNSELRAIVDDGGDAGARAQEQMEAMHTDVALRVTEGGGNVTSYTSAGGRVEDRSFDVNVRLVLFDRRANAITWDALVHYAGYHAVATLQDGKDFAKSVFARLRSDGLVACD